MYYIYFKNLFNLLIPSQATDWLKLNILGISLGIVYYDFWVPLKNDLTTFKKNP